MHSVFQCNLHDWLFVWFQAEKEINGFIFFPKCESGYRTSHISFTSLLSPDRSSNNISNHLLWLEIHKSNSDQQTLPVSKSNFIAIEWYCTETFLIMVSVDVINILLSGWGGVFLFYFYTKYFLLFTGSQVFFYSSLTDEEQHFSAVGKENKWRRKNVLDNNHTSFV